MQIAKIENVTFKYSDAKFTIKELLSGDLSKIKDKTMKVSLSIEKEDDELVQKQSIEALMELERLLKIQTALVGWENVTDENGKEMICDNAGKKRFCENLPDHVFKDFGKVFFEEYKKMVNALTKQREKTVKN